MNFGSPDLLWLLLIPAALLLWSEGRRRAAGGALSKILRAEAGRRNLRLAPPAERPADSRRRLRWLVAGLALGAAALARPRWGRIEQPSFSSEREVVVALDLSRSMLSTDVKPSRLDRAKLLLQALLDRLQGERVGLVVFSGTAFLQAPLSSDHEILREFLPSLNPGFMPVGGTDYGAMLDAAAGAFAGRSQASRFLVVLSDGGANDEGWRSHIAALQAKGVRVIALGVGTDAGSFIPDGAGGFMKDDNGAVVLSRLDRSTLRELAAKTGGVYLDAGNWVDLDRLLRSTVEAGRAGRFSERRETLLAERYQWALAPALLCLLLSFWLEFPVRPKPRRLGAAEGLVSLLLLAAAFGAAPLRADEATPAEGQLLGRIVGRLSGQDRPSAADWAEFARETVSWGQSLRQTQQPVPSGPVRDALAAVDAGSALDARASNWGQLRGELQDLLRPPPQKPQPPPPPQQKQQPKQSAANPSNASSPPRNSPQQRQKQQPQSSAQAASAQPSSPQAGQSQPQNSSVLGSFAPPPPSTGTGMQTVGGSVARPKQTGQASDPSLLALQQKLDQVRDQDSPGELFRMMENNQPHPPATAPGKDW